MKFVMAITAGILFLAAQKSQAAWYAVDLNDRKPACFEIPEKTDLSDLVREEWMGGFQVTGTATKSLRNGAKAFEVHGTTKTETATYTFTSTRGSCLPLHRKHIAEMQKAQEKADAFRVPEYTDANNRTYRLKREEAFQPFELVAVRGNGDQESTYTLYSTEIEQKIMCRSAWDASNVTKKLLSTFDIIGTSGDHSAAMVTFRGRQKNKPVNVMLMSGNDSAGKRFYQSLWVGSQRYLDCALSD